ncbi:MAG TPA: Gfo/Idh/MocA family oxidoreductase [Phnomibacter sp.]|nr:Gfo/Idh/MocA family oxidoreductase [Phnomibacter sp.]
MSEMDKPLRFALIGCGRIGARHADIMQKHGQVVAVCDIEPAKSQNFALQFEAKGFTDHTLMLQAMQSQIDVVSVCSPNGLHALHTIESLGAGCHVLCEKPMALTRKDADAMMEAAKAAGKYLWVVKQNRYNPPVQAVKSLLDQGKLGKIYSVQLNCYWNRPEAYYADSWKGTLAMDGGTLYTQFSHFIDLLIWFFGPFEPLHVQLANFHHQGIIDFEDTGIVTGKFNSGALVSFHYTVNAFQQNMEGSITIFGEKGTVKIGGQYLNKLEYQQLESEPITGLPTGNPPNQYGNYVGSMSNHPQVYESLVQVLTGQGKMINSIEEAAATVDAIEKIYRMAGRSMPYQAETGIPAQLPVVH